MTGSVSTGASCTTGKEEAFTGWLGGLTVETEAAVGVVHRLLVTESARGAEKGADDELEGSQAEGPTSLGFPQPVEETLLEAGVPHTHDFFRFSRSKITLGDSYGENKGFPFKRLRSRSPPGVIAHALQLKALSDTM